MKRIILLSCSALALFSCSKQGKDDTYKIIYEDQTKVAENAKAIKDKQPIKLIPGLKIDLWASDSLSPDPVSLEIDNLGRAYITRAVRQKNSEFDIRGHRDWMTASISLQSVEDRRAFLRKTFAPENSEKNKWLKDLNEDGSHDWKDLTVEKDEIWRVEDKDGDGVAETFTHHAAQEAARDGVVFEDEDLHGHGWISRRAC